jgi:hypothetical protein
MNGPLPTWGVVRDHLFRQPLPVGMSLISLGVPLMHSPTTAHLLVADGFTGTTSQSTSDKCYVWQGDSTSTQAWDTYWYLVNGTLKQWMKAGGGSTNYTTTSLFPRHRAFFAIGYSTAKPTRAVPCPWLP